MKNKKNHCTSCLASLTILFIFWRKKIHVVDEIILGYVNAGAPAPGQRGQEILELVVLAMALHHLGQHPPRVIAREVDDSRSARLAAWRAGCTLTVNVQEPCSKRKSEKVVKRMSKVGGNVKKPGKKSFHIGKTNDMRVTTVFQMDCNVFLLIEPSPRHQFAEVHIFCHLSEILTVTLRCWTGLNHNWFKSYDTKWKWGDKQLVLSIVQGVPH